MRFSFFDFFLAWVGVRATSLTFHPPLCVHVCLAADHASGSAIETRMRRMERTLARLDDAVEVLLSDRRRGAFSMHPLAPSAPQHALAGGYGLPPAVAHPQPVLVAHGMPAHAPPVAVTAPVSVPLPATGGTAETMTSAPTPPPSTDPPKEPSLSLWKRFTRRCVDLICFCFFCP